MQAGRRIALSGILSDQKGEVAKCYSPWIAFAPPAEAEGWCASPGQAVSMITRCPTCATVFRVTEPQLSARAGQVRCGRCGALFDALAALSQAFQPPGREGQEGPPISASMASCSTKRGTCHSTSDRSRGASKPAVVVCKRVSTARSCAASGLSYRGEVAVLLPEAKPLVQRICANSVARYRYRVARSCSVSSLRTCSGQQPSQRDGADGNASEPRCLHPGVPRFGADPHRHRGQTVARRVLTSKDYAPQGARSEPGFAAGSELQIRVYLEAAALKPTGYRLYLFYL